MIGARSTIKPNTAALAVATADWGTRGDSREALPVCLEVPANVRGIWTSDDADARAAAAAFCGECPRRRSCLRLAIDSDAQDGTFGGFALGTSAGRREALEWLGDIPARRPRRVPTRKRVAS